MTSFLRRLKIYGIGFLMGCVLVFFFFSNRGCSWLPSNRVKNSILERVIVASEKQNVGIKQFGLSDKDIQSVLDDGEVIYEKSQKEKGKLKYYLIQKEFNNKKIDFTFTLPEESFISEVFINERVISTTKSGKGNFIYFPNDKFLISLDTNDRLFCAQSYFKISKTEVLLEDVKKYGSFNFSKSQLNVKPKPTHVLEVKKGGKLLESEAVWYKNKIHIVDFYNVPDSIYLNCKTNLVNN